MSSPQEDIIYEQKQIHFDNDLPKKVKLAFSKVEVKILRTHLSPCKESLACFSCRTKGQPGTPYCFQRMNGDPQINVPCTENIQKKKYLTKKFVGRHCWSEVAVYHVWTGLAELPSSQLKFPALYLTLFGDCV